MRCGGSRIRSSPVNVRSFSSARPSGGELSALLDAVKSRGVLTVGETDDFTGLGGIISFRLDGPRVRIKVDLQTAEHARLRISSKLLSLAEIAKKQP